LALAMLLAAVPLRANAADNTAVGDIAGIDADLGDSNTFTLNAMTLALVKTAFRGGTELTSGATLPRGTLVQFMVYIDNPTGVSVTDVNVSDVLDPGFSYQVSSIKVDNTAATGSTPADIYLAVSAAATVTDANDGDVAGISGTTITAGSTGGNGQLDIAANAVWAILFDVTVQ
jgi:uncharacterized repeat protein (TIGR01451 family)